MFLLSLNDEVSTLKVLMKTVVIVLILLTALVTLLPLYPHWAEFQRLNRIEKVKQKARPVLGERLETVFSEIRSSELPSLILLYTGGTKSHLEPCGCYQEQSGGLPRRAYIVAQIRQLEIPTVLVDAGDIFDGNEEIDAQRCLLNLKAMSEIGYDAAALSQSDLSYDNAYLIKHATFPLLAENTTGTQPFLVKQAGDYSVAFVSTSGNDSRPLPIADIHIALGPPAASDSDNFDVVILPNEIETIKSESGAFYVGSKSEGKTLGFVALWVSSKMELTRYYATQLALTGEVEESESIRQLLTDFYREIAQSSEFIPLFSSQSLEKQTKNGYVSATACQSCHQQAYRQWTATPHAFAFETLLKKERYFDPSCVSCHTTGFAYPTGFQIGDEMSTLKGVQCETCHGPGKQHIKNPQKSNIRRANETTLCLECHDTKHSPGFAEVVALHTKDVDHSREPMNLEDLLASRTSQVRKPIVELFTMSHCPASIQAEKELIPILKKFGDAISFKLHFIAEEKENPTKEDIPPFTSLRGYSEVVEDIRQVLIAKYYPEQYLDYILCRGEKPNEIWETCAQKLNIDIDKIQAIFDSPEAEELFRENVKRTAELGISASPTLLIDNQFFQVNQLLQTSGTACQ